MSVGFPYRTLIDQVYLPMFYEKGEAAVQGLLGSSIARLAFLAAYRDLVPVEKISQQEQNELLEYVQSIWPEKTEEEKKEFQKIIYTIGTISN